MRILFDPAVYKLRNKGNLALLQTALAYSYAYKNGIDTVDYLLVSSQSYASKLTFRFSDISYTLFYSLFSPLPQGRAANRQRQTYAMARPGQVGSAIAGAQLPWWFKKTQKYEFVS